MLTGRVITGGMKPIVEKYQTQGQGGVFPHREKTSEWSRDGVRG